jgi:predicted  nucleic acid-binding Zn-ribbon protein
MLKMENAIFKFSIAEQIVKKIRNELLSLEAKHTAIQKRHDEISKKTRSLSNAYSLGFNPSLMQKLEQEIKRTKEQLSDAEERLSKARARLALETLKSQIRMERDALVEERRELESQKNQIRMEREALER